MPTIEELKEQHQNEWLAIDVTQSRDGEPLEGELVYHSAHRDEVWEKTKDQEKLYITFAGPPLKEGYAAAF